MSWERYDRHYQEKLKKEFEEQNQYEWVEKKNGQPEAILHSSHRFNDHSFSIVKMNCAFCNKTMYLQVASYNLGLKYCSSSCASRAGAKVVADQRKEMQNKVCPACGKAFTAARKDTKYCSKACKQMAYRKKIKTEEALVEAKKQQEKVPNTKTITIGNVKVFCIELNQEWWYQAEPILLHLHFLASEKTIQEYVPNTYWKRIVFRNDKDNPFAVINTAGLISLLLACRLPEAKEFREAVVSKTMLKPGKSGSPVEWTDVDKKLADPDYPLQVLMEIIEAQRKDIQ